MKRRLARLCGLALVALAMAGSFGCNTLRGVGQDVEEGGEKIQDVAE